MATCPHCIGRADIREIQLIELNMNCEDFFYCKKCKGIFEFREIEKENLETVYSEDFIKELYGKINDAEQKDGE